MNDIYSILFSFLVTGALIANYLLLRMGTYNGVYMTIWGALNILLLVGYVTTFVSGSLIFLLMASTLLVSLIARRRVVKQLDQSPVVATAAEPERIAT